MKKFRRTFHRAPVVLSWLLIGGLAASPAWAGTIQSANLPASGPGMGNVEVPVIFTANPNAVDDNNIDINFKRFDHVGYIDIEFDIANSGGTTTYRVVEAVDNNAGPPPNPIVPWIGYRVELGFGVGSAFTLATAADGLSFNTTETTMSAAFADHAFDTDAVVLTYSNGLHASGQQSYEFRVNVPDNLLDNRFTLRQTPVPIPEPGSLVLCGLAVYLCGGFVRRRV